MLALLCGLLVLTYVAEPPITIQVTQRKTTAILRRFPYSSRMATARPTTVLVVDDHALIRSALVSVLNATDDLRVVCEASNGADAVELAHKHSPSVVVLDVDMPGVDAFHAASHILQLRPHTAIMFLTATDSDRAIEQALKVGALGFIVKSDDPDAIPGAIRAIARGEQYFSPRAAERVRGDTSAIRKRKITGTRGTAISEREIEVLRYVGKGYAKKQIAEMLGISVKTVDKHVTSVMEKLDIHDRVELALYAVREGFITA
ncbi:MAG: DNA-binding response regulator [Planctomycetota bacterium]|nr:MAG: DNA-binding response regulator [Planctomycetota bacterium]